MTDKRRRGRFVTLHPDEDLLQTARVSEPPVRFREQYRWRVGLEHSIRRLVQLDVRKNRFCGRTNTRFHVLMAATV